MDIMEASQIQLLSKKIIIPSSQTPQLLKSYQLSFPDQLRTSEYLPLTLFYSHKDRQDLSSVSNVLEKSFSQVLSSYYPYAGRIVDNVFVDCNDKGALFVETEIKNPMSEIFSQPFSAAQSALYPGDAFPWIEPRKGGYLAAAQLNHFECGGKALSLCLTHKLGDSDTFFNFINDWATMARQTARGSGAEVSLPSPPELIGASLLPPTHDPSFPQLFEPEIRRDATIAKRFHFDGSTIDELFSLVSSQSDVKNPTRAEVVTAILNRCAVISATKNNDPFRPFILFMPFNLRKLLKPPLPDKLVGNFLAFFLVPIMHEGDLEIPTLVGKIRKEKIRHFRKYRGINRTQTVSTIFDDTEDFRQNNLENMRLTTSVCGYQFYDIDFGFGKPVRVSIGAMPTKYSIVLFDSPCRSGIDAVVTLEDKVMLKFENDEELHMFASLDPSY